jgi:hypothetical protein
LEKCGYYPVNPIWNGHRAPASTIKTFEIEQSNIPLIHHIRVPKTSNDYPQDDISAGWEVCSPQSMPRFSAVGYFFAKELTERLHVPIGLIHASWGGSAIEAWTPKKYHRSRSRIFQMAVISFLKTIHTLSPW